jgi:putative endonuclease
VHYWLFWYYRFFDRTLCRPVCLGEEDRLESGQWNQFIGDLGEDLARRWMWSRGIKVLYRQFSAQGGGEVDIVARDGEVLVFCEVKTRTSAQFGRPADAVDQEKQKLITRGANAWIQELGFIPLLFRFDIIEVLLIDGEIPEINHIPNAFQAAPRLLA